eukprot:scaffold97333_cov96-Phaeocystis_antarctica.AAC.3
MVDVARADDWCDAVLGEPLERDLHERSVAMLRADSRHLVALLGTEAKSFDGRVGHDAHGVPLGPGRECCNGSHRPKVDHELGDGGGHFCGTQQALDAARAVIGYADVPDLALLLHVLQRAPLRFYEGARALQRAIDCVPCRSAALSARRGVVEQEQVNIARPQFLEASLHRAERIDEACT